MDLFSLQENYSLVMVEALAIFLVVYSLSFIYNRTTSTAPEAGGAWPIIGHFKLFGASSDLPHLALASLADRYGPIFTVRLGIRRVLVVSGWEIAKEIFTTHDVIVSDRPKYLAAKILGHNYAAFSFAPYGPYWRGMRKTISLELLSSSRLDKLQFVQVFELENSIKNMLQLWREKRDEEGKVLVEMKRWFGELTMNIVLRMVAGKRYTSTMDNDEDEEETKKLREVMREWFLYLGRFVMADALPFLGWLDLGGYEKTMKRVATELDLIVGKWLAEHRQKRDSDKITGARDFIDVMISEVESGAFENYDADTIVKATCTSLIIGGTDTTSVMLTWALSLLLNNRYALRKAQEELETHVEKDRQVNELDIKNLVYLQAIVKETLRLYPAGFLGGPRAFSKDCTVSGYHVPKGTWLLINMWKLHRDPKIWSDPLEFRPERFLTPNHKDVDVKGGDFELIPFGAGRRSCPGMGFGLQALHLVLATLLHNFDISTPNGAPVDMTETAGMTNAKATPLEVLVIPRLVATING
ncbi:cytochrome P450 CYP82D47-like [Cynara cardunculus var. scolymus]|uniref:cytochrome P450 CYP82D47-like n=1 Tax=Cynara cardunculus var. scolymus TaxID=59895 RepID=UPI000D626B60|nr:cytochrome P450 CYP82D47-like [Cynara cardunculus var. scolymus]